MSKTPAHPNPSAELEDRLRFETLIADLSSKFVNLPPGEVDREIMDAERRICDLLGLDFAVLWQWSDESPVGFTVSHFYSVQDGPQPPERMQQDMYPWARQELLAGRVITISSLEQLPEEAARDRENLEQFGIKSNLTLPLSVGGGPPVGILGLNTTRAERDWPDPLVKRLHLVAQVFANALARKRADQALRESEERLSLTTASAGAGLWALDCRSGIFWATEEARRLFGYAPEDVISMERFKASIHPEDLELVERKLERAVHAGEPVNLEYRIRIGDRHTRWISSRGRTHFDAAGKPDRLMGVSVDVTERKGAEEALRFSEARLAVGVDLAGLGYYEIDYGGNDCFCDGRFREICGIPPELNESLRPVEFWADHVHPDDLPHLLAERQKLHDGKVDDISTEYRYLHPAEGEKWIHHLARIAGRGDDSGSVRTYGVIRDITRQRQTEEEARELRGNLAHADRVTLLGQLATALAHELSQPLAAILRNAEAAEIMLQDPAPDLEELRAIITDILSDDQRAGQVIDRLRSLLKKGSVELQPVALPELLTAVLSLVQADAAARHVRLIPSVMAELPPVRGDRVQLQQVLLNLLVNAIDVLDGCTADRCEIRVSARLLDPATVEIRVCDSGSGIPPETLGRLFEPFFTTKATGLGMGLPVSKRIIEAHKGKLWAENGPDGGACFCFTLPTAGVAGIRER